MNNEWVGDIVSCYDLWKMNEVGIWVAVSICQKWMRGWYGRLSWFFDGLDMSCYAVITHWNFYILDMFPGPLAAFLQAVLPWLSPPGDIVAIPIIFAIRIIISVISIISISSISNIISIISIITFTLDFVSQLLAHRSFTKPSSFALYPPS